MRGRDCTGFTWRLLDIFYIKFCFSCFYKLCSLHTYLIKPHQNRPSKSRILAGYQILDFTFFLSICEMYTIGNNLDVYNWK